LRHDETHFGRRFDALSSPQKQHATGIVPVATKEVILPKG